MLMKINQFNSVMTFIHILFQPHLVIFKLFPLKHQVIRPPNISPVREKRRIITKSYGPSCDCACFCVSKCVCVCAFVYQLTCFTPPSRCCFNSTNLRMAFFRSRTVAFCTTTMASEETLHRQYF